MKKSPRKIRSLSDRLLSVRLRDRVCPAQHNHFGAWRSCQKEREHVDLHCDKTGYAWI